MRNFTTLALLHIYIFAYSQRSPYINKVYEYRPAPGQFVNTMPQVTEAMTEADVQQKAEEQLVGKDTPNPGIVTLGSWGGYVTFGFDHPIVNVAGQRDFKVYGNAYAGNSEAGIVLVSRDENGNGIPDDTWYELAGSDYNSASTLHGYRVTYSCPADPLTENYAWTSNDATEPQGSVLRNTFHKQNYWPLWIKEKEMTFSGTRLASNGEKLSTGTYRLNAFAWGYADNLSNAEEQGFDIGWAVDEEGKSVLLPAIDFVRVHTAMQQTLPMIGESSTEVCGAEDLHPAAIATAIALPAANGGIVTFYNMEGMEVPHPTHGLYIRKQGGRRVKVIMD